MVLGGVAMLIIGSGGGTRLGIIFLILAAVDLALVVPLIRKHRGSSAGQKVPVTRQDTTR
jgi:hypothetical protein